MEAPNIATPKIAPFISVEVTADYSLMRCLSSQTRSAASSKLFVRVSVPTAGNSLSTGCALLLFRGRPRFALGLPARRAVSLSGRWPALFMAAEKAACEPAFGRCSNEEVSSHAAGSGRLLGAGFPLFCPLCPSRFSASLAGHAGGSKIGVPERFPWSRFMRKRIPKFRPGRGGLSQLRHQSAIRGTSAKVS